LGCKISYEKKGHNFKNICKYLQILGVLNNVMKPNFVHRQSRSKLYSILAMPSLLYGCEMWMKFMRCTAGYDLLDSINNVDILELDMCPIENKLERYL
jgi:hypothetical protein